MTYWHMQLHPANPAFGLELEILQSKGVIGLGDWESTQVDQFKKEMRIGDIVLIKNGGSPIALVEVIGDVERENNPNKEFDWFDYRRKIKLLAIKSEDKHDFPMPRGTLKKSVNPHTETYQYINNWYNTISKNKSVVGLKIRGLYISKYKALSDFNINLTSNEGEINSVIVLAGVNGSGKTSILEYLYQFETSPSFNKDDCLNVFMSGRNITIYKNSNKNEYPGIKEYKNNVFYFPVFNKIEDVSSEIISYINKMIFEYDYTPSGAYKELQDRIHKIFEGFDLSIKFEALDKNKNIYFSNHLGEEFLIEDLSTGEKTLLSKILYFYLKEIKDSIILIDEPEMSLHPKWQSIIFNAYEKFANETNNQIIMATHSPQLIASVPYRKRILLKKIDGKIVPVPCHQPPSGLDVNSILSEIMGADPRPSEILELYRQYRQFVEEYKENTPEALAVKAKLSEESDHSQFMQEMNFLIELREL